MKTLSRLLPTGLILLFLLSNNLPAQESELWDNWVKSTDNPIECPDDAWFDDTWRPVIIYEDGKYMMWFTGYKNNWLRQIGYAESDDGLCWQFAEEPVIKGGTYASPQRHKMIGNVMRVDDTLRIWYVGLDEHRTEYSIYYAWSIDGLEWNLHPLPVLKKGEPGSWDEKGVFGWPVYYDGTTYHMLYNDLYDIGYATSFDGINWEKDLENNPIFRRGPEGSWYDEWVCPGPVIVKNDVIHMFFSGSDGLGGQLCAGYIRIGCAWSKDFINWKIANDEEYIIDKGGLGEWDFQGAFVASVLHQNDQYKIWYSGHNQQWAIGSAGLVTDIGELSQPDQVSLDISPSPFKDEVAISCQVSGQSHVRLEIFNLNGQQITTLIDESIDPGKHEVLFNGASLTPGMYFCVLETEHQIITKKFIKQD